MIRSSAVAALRSLSSRAAALADRLTPPEEVSLHWVSDRVAKLEAAWVELRALPGRVEKLEELARAACTWAAAEEVLRPKDGQWPNVSAQELDRNQARAAEALRTFARGAK